MALTAEQVLAASDIDTEAIDVPEWGGKVYIRGLTAAQRDRYDREIVQIDKNGNTSIGRLENLRALLVVRCLVAEDGTRLFEDRQARELGEKSSVVIGRLWEVAAKLSGMSVTEEEAVAESFGGPQDGGNSSE
jgi:hypothetical protein